MATFANVLPHRDIYIDNSDKYWIFFRIRNTYECVRWNTEEEALAFLTALRTMIGMHGALTAYPTFYDPDVWIKEAGRNPEPFAAIEGPIPVVSRATKSWQQLYRAAGRKLESAKDDFMTLLEELENERDELEEGSKTYRVTDSHVGLLEELIHAIDQSVDTLDLDLMGDNDSEVP